jgi:uncharacterized membrane protein YfcA
MILTAPHLIILALSGAFAGFIGALAGVGGGAIVVPILVLGFGLDIKIAIASSLVAVVASSTAAGSVYVGKGLANMRLGMSLEIATTLGAIAGVLLAVLISPVVVCGIFSFLMVVTSVMVIRTSDVVKAPGDVTPLFSTGTGHETAGSLSGSYYDPLQNTLVHYEATRLLFGSFMSFFAGILSGMLGIGGGFMKVPAMTLGMKVPMKVAAGTSNFMIGVTAISSLFVYFARGYVHPIIACPVAIGVVGGALYGTSVAQKISPKMIRKVFAVILILVALQMFLKAIGVNYVK